MPDTASFPRRRATKLRHPDIITAHWDEYVLGEDEHGQWAILPAGDPTFFAVGDVSRLGDDQVRCYDRDGRWVAQFWCGGRVANNVLADGSTRSNVIDLTMYVDMARVLPGEDGGMSFVDLVLDVARFVDDRGVTVLDEDEVAEEMERYGIPAGHIDAARVVCAEVFALMAADKAPFDDATAATWRARFHAEAPAG